MFCERTVLVFLFLMGCTAVRAAGESSFNAFVGTTVALPCTVDTKQCGALHSVKWYRDMSRIYVFSHAGGIARAEGDATDRMTVEYSEKSMEARLKISSVEVDDEATYKCEITYLEVRENCDVVQIVKLTTLVKPTSVTIRDNNGMQLVNASMLGPKDEGTDVEIICEAGGGKPVPRVRWYNQTTELKWATFSQTIHRNGTGTGRSKLKMTLSKGDLGTKFECRVESMALEKPVIAFVIAEVYVRPTSIEVKGVNQKAIAGMEVMLLCDVYGAKPAAEITWFNGSTEVDHNISKIDSATENNKDGTFTTKSTLTFVASRYENGKIFNCNGENQVTKNNNEPALRDNVLVEIQYPPVVNVSPLNITVNESASPFLGCSYVANPQKLQKVIWSKDDTNLTLADQRYEGGTIRNPPLRIKNVSREDMGYYNCWLENSVNMVKSENSIFLIVMYPPVVTVEMTPALVIAQNRHNVSLYCNVTSGNPSNLLKVRWYFGGELMKEFPECDYTTFENGTRVSGGQICDIDPSILLLKDVDENFAGNYTCQGMNAAGWGAESEPQELIVYYPPSPAKLRFFPTRVIKSASVNLECSIDNPGRPENTTFLWYRGSHLIPEITSSNWTISPVTLETRSNFTCIPENEGGQGKPDTVEINVDAPPSFIQNLIPYQGILYNSRNISLTCRVECWPVCSIVWLIGGKPLDVNTSSLYYVRTEIYPSDVKKNDFESVESTLIWNLTAWPNHQLDKSAANTNYTCKSYANGVGAGVVSTSEVAVDYAPEDVGIFYQDQYFLAPNHVINVVEGQLLTPVRCVGKGHPTLNFQWRNDTSESSKTDTLQITTLSRFDSVSYICEASNKHGTTAIKTYFNVQYIPECSVTLIQKEGKPTLLCTAVANPQEVSFTWRVEEYNETYVETENIIQDGLHSYLFLDPAVDTARTYFCYVNNSVGISSPCEKSVAGARPWWNNMEDENKIIVIIASSAVLILCVLVICIIIIILCRRKRANTKYNSPLEMEEREKPDGYSPDTPNQRWPLRPGILVPGHKLQNINIIQLDREISPFKTTSVSRKLAQSKYAKNRPKVYARLERLKTFLGFNGYDYVPSGLTQRSSGVVTYKKSTLGHNSEIPSTMLSRKRKKPGAVPNQSSIGDKTGLGAAPPVGGIADPTYDPDKGFYENLPFHSMQNPPNKPISVIAPFNQEQTQNIKPTLSRNSAKSIPNICVKRHQSFSGFPRNLQPVYNSNNFLNFSNSQYFNYKHPSISMNNSSEKQFNSQNILNKSSVPRMSNPKSKSQYLKNQSFSTLSVQNFDMRRLNLSLPIADPQKNPFDVPSQKMNRIKTVCSNEKFICKSESLKLKQIDEPNEQLPKINKCNATSKEYTTQSDGEVHNESNDSLEKHKCYSPTFYSLRCKKHSKKRTVVYAVPKRILSDGDLPNCQDSGTPDNESIKHVHIVPIPAPRCRKHRKREIIYQNMAEALKNSSIPNLSNETDDDIELSSGKEVIPTTEVEIHSSPKSKKNHLEEKSTDEVDSIATEAHKPIISSPLSTKTICSPKNSLMKSSADTRPKLVAVSPKKSTDIPLSTSAFKRSPTVKVCPNIKSKTEIKKGALSIQIQAKIKGSSSHNPSLNPSIQNAKSDKEKAKAHILPITKDEPKNSPNSKPNNSLMTRDNTKKVPKVKSSPNRMSPSPNTSSQNTTSSISDIEVPKMSILDTSENKWSSKFNQNIKQNAFYTLTAPHHQKPPSIDLAAHYSATIPHLKHAKLIPRALFQEQQLTKSKSFSSKSKHKKHFQIPLQKCHSFKFQTAESYFQPIKNLHEENLMKNGYVSDYADCNRMPRSNNKRDKHKQKTNGPLVVMRQNDYQDSLSFQENVQNSVHLQYPQLGLNSLKPQSGRPNGIVYADLDMPKPSKKASSNNLSKPKQQKHKPKTEYATLQFNDVGQEIDV